MRLVPPSEDLHAELVRLIGCSDAVAAAVVQCLLDALRGARLDGLGPLARYPMTAWHAIAAANPAVDAVWSALGRAGLDDEASFTALALLDDHVRRTFGDDAWSRPADWLTALAGPRLDREGVNESWKPAGNRSAPTN